MKRGATWIGLGIGLAALILQFVITIPLRLEKGDSIFGAVIFYFSFFTILTNIMLVLIYWSDLRPRESMRWFRSPVTRGMMVAAIALVSLFYHFVLAATWAPEGWARVADICLHYATPIFYIVWWALFMRHAMLKWNDIPTMLIPPTIYLGYVLVRGAIVSEYPYPILEANRLGYGVVAMNVLYVLAGLIVLSAIVVALDRVLNRIDLPGP